MFRINRHFIWSVFLILVVVINLLNVRVVLADDSTPPPPPTEEPNQPPVESTETPVVETPVPTEIPISESPVPLEAPFSAADLPIIEEQAPALEEAVPSELLTQLPENTNLVVLDETGNPVPLASQEALDIILDTDPLWCPDGVLPGGLGCTTNFASISLLINNMVNPTHTPSYAHHGVIYFTAIPGSGAFNLTDTNLGTGVFDTLNDFNLTLQGGWNGDTVSPSFSGQTNFGTSPVTIGSSVNPWIGNITLNDLTFTGANQASVTVYTTTGNITLNNVAVNNQANGKNTALLGSTSGNIAVSNGTYDGNNSNSAGFSATTTSGSITISDTSFTENKKPTPASTFDGATLSAPVVTLTNVTATSNDGNGIKINNADVVTLNNVLANSNGTDITPLGAANNTGSGVFFNGNAGSSLFINGGGFNSNQKYGVEVGNPANTTIYILSNPTCTGNIWDCSNDTFVIDGTAPVITPTASGTAGSNGWYTSDVAVSWSVTDAESGVSSSTGCTASNLTTDTTGITVTCSATNNVGLSNSVSVTIKIDKTAPVLAIPSDITTTATGPSGAVVNYSVSATDNLDPSATAICSPVSGSAFSLGTTTVNCSFTDPAGNTASGSFQVTVGSIPVITPLPVSAPTSTSGSSSGSSSSHSISSGLNIPVTGGELITLDCNSAFWAFGVKLTFLNLCGHQTSLNPTRVNNLPGELPNGFSFVMGFDIEVLSENQIIDSLPNGAGIQMDFPISGGPKEQFAVLYWNGSEWIEISQQISDDKISRTADVNADDEFYQIQSTTDSLYKVLTTELIGTFVLVKK